MDKTKIRTPQLENEVAMALHLSGDNENAFRLINWRQRRDKYINRNCSNDCDGSRAPSISECIVFAWLFLSVIYFL